MKLFSFTTLLLVAFCGYLINTVWTLYQLWHPHACDISEKNCLISHIHQRKDIKWNMKIYSSAERKSNFRPNDQSSTLLWTWKNINFTEYKSKSFNVTLPASTKHNGSLYVHFFLYQKGKSAFKSSASLHSTTSLTDFEIPVSFFNLMNNKTQEETNDEKQPITHWRPTVYIHVMEEDFSFHPNQIPNEFLDLLRITQRNEYLPLFYIDELSYKKSDLVPIPKNATTMKVDISYAPIGVGKLRLWLTLTESMKAMMSLGFTDNDLDEVKGIFTDTNLLFLALTVVISMFHLLFDFLAFKNDITYWKRRKTMAGLSFHTVVYRCVSTIIIFLYLLDQRTSLLVVVPAGIGSIIEIWKVTKALKVKVERSGWKLKFTFGESSDNEKTTEDFDQQAIKYLSYVMYPLCIGAAIYSLFYVPHKSWYSWVVQSLVNGVYAFGFLFMLPQLFINYKLKSVAHLPWRAFMYKAFNTFIDDIFAFIIRMPTGHRLACFRDDIVFFCYLYQLWLYPVDKRRANEYGISYEDEHEKKD